jgi:hypothetical protein
MCKFCVGLFVAYYVFCSQMSFQFQQSTSFAVTRRAAQLLQAKVNALTLLILLYADSCNM